MKKIGLVLVLLIVSILSLFVGVTDITLWDLLAGDPDKTRIFMMSRIPRLMAIILTGFGMSICGLIMQQITMNKFVSPTTGGTLESAKLGILLSILFFPNAGLLGMSIFAFACSIAGTFTFMAILNRITARNTVYIPLVGIMFGSVIGAITSFLGYTFDLSQTINSWMYGKFALIISGRYELMYIVVPLVIIAFIYAKRFTLAGLGEEFSTNLGLNYKQVVNIGLAIVSITSATIVLIAGTIPFIGLIVPNIVSIYKGDNLEENIFTTGIVGAIFLLVCDVIGRIVIYPYEIPIGLSVGVLGSGIFLGLLIRRRNHEG